MHYQITWHRATQTRRKATQRDESCRENAITSSAGELNSQKAITVPGKKAANLWPDYNIHIQVSRQTQSHLGSMAMRRPKTGSASALYIYRGKIVNSTPPPPLPLPEPFCVFLALQNSESRTQKLFSCRRDIRLPIYHSRRVVLRTE